MQKGDLIFGCVLLGIVYFLVPYIENYKTAKEYQICINRTRYEIWFYETKDFFDSFYPQNEWKIIYHLRHRRCPFIPPWSMALEPFVESLETTRHMYEWRNDYCRELTGYQGPDVVRPFPVVYMTVKDKSPDRLVPLMRMTGK